jgi:hypothetical protein
MKKKDSLTHIVKISKMMTSYDKSNKFNTLSRWRFLFLVFGIIVFIIAYFVGAILVKINASQVEFIKRHFEERINGINQY